MQPVAFFRSLLRKAQLVVCGQCFCFLTDDMKSNFLCFRHIYFSASNSSLPQVLNIPLLSIWNHSTQVLCLFTSLLDLMLIILLLLVISFDTSTFLYDSGLSSRTSKPPGKELCLNFSLGFLYFIIYFLGFIDEALADFLDSVGQILFWKGFQKREKSIFTRPVSIKKSTSTIITPYKVLNDPTSAKL